MQRLMNSYGSLRQIQSPRRCPGRRGLPWARSFAVLHPFGSAMGGWAACPEFARSSCGMPEPLGSVFHGEPNVGHRASVSGLVNRSSPSDKGRPTTVRLWSSERAVGPAGSAPGRGGRLSPSRYCGRDQLASSHAPQVKRRRNGPRYGYRTMPGPQPAGSTPTRARPRPGRKPVPPSTTSRLTGRTGTRPASPQGRSPGHGAGFTPAR